MMTEIDSVDLYKKLYTIRCSEQCIIREYDKDEMKTPMHMSVGQEFISVGVISALDKDDQIVTSYRTHAAYLAKTDDVEGFFAEMYGKKTGVLGGKAGSMHLCNPDKGYPVSTAIVASGIPVACGMAYANKIQNNGRIVAVFFGDGAIDEGNFWESLNIACVMQLPILFVNEDNGLAVHTSKEQRHGYLDIRNIVKDFRCQVFTVDDNEVETVYKRTKESIESIRLKERPSFLYVNCYRYLEHVGVKEDFDAGYRKKNEWWYHNDCLKLQEEKVRGVDLISIKQSINDRVEAAIAKAKTDEFPDLEELYD